MRLNKYIADSGFCSRRKADKLIEDGVVTINGKVAVIGEQMEASDVIKINNTVISTEGKDLVYLAYNKPVGVICTSDPNAHNNIIDAVNHKDRIVHIGRLDVASSGLILLTNDNDIVNKILRSENGHEKEYVVTVNKPINRKYLDKLREGVILDGIKTKPARVKKVSDTRYKIIITEGRNRQIRRMAEAFSYKVTKLKRVRIMNIELRELGEGNTRELSKRERRELLAMLG